MYFLFSIYISNLISHCALGIVGIQQDQHTFGPIGIQED